MEELIEGVCSSMKLLDKEKAGILITEDDTAELRMRSGRCLVGRIMSERKIQKEAFRTLMARLWKTRGDVAFKELDVNLWLIEFSNGDDKRRVLEGRPWLFDRNILVLKEVVEDVAPVQMDFSSSLFWIQVHDMPLICMNREVGYKIGASIGVVEEVDVTGEGVGWGRCLRIRVEVDITKPLERGRVLDLNGKPIWVSFRYEKLPYFCHFCGRIVHDKESCDGKRGFRQNAGDTSRQWGSWLQADDLRSYKGHFWTGGERSDWQRRGVFVQFRRRRFRGWEEE
jgi:hypothetical protein